MFTGKTAIVTGGSRGIGRAVALALAGHHAKTAVFYAGNETAARETAAFAAEAGGEIRTVRCDVSDSASVKQACGALQEEWGGIDFLINCAGITRDGLMMRMKDEDFDAVLSTNLRGAFLMTRACAGTMVRRRFGRIVNISSVSGLCGNAGQANYSAAKAGMIGLTKSVARELAGRGITCNAIAPGFIETDMTAGLSQEVRESYAEGIPLKRLGTPDDVAQAVAFLASPEAGYITGQVLAVNGGMYC